MTYTTTLRDCYKELKPLHSWKTCKAVWETVGEVMMEHLLKGKILLVPWLGKFCIVRYKAKKALPDYGTYRKSLKKGEVVKVVYNNRHTGGYSVRILWDRVYEGPTLWWGFNATRTHKRKSIAAHVKTNGVYDYVEKIVK